MEIKNITIAEYFTQHDNAVYDYLINYTKDSKDIYSMGDFTQLPFGEVKEIQYKYSKGATIKDVLNFISEKTKKDLKELAKLSILDFIKINNYIKNQVEFINNLEETSLVGTIEPDEEQAGIDRFNKFGYVSQLNSLALNDITKYEQVRSVTYIDCFTKLLLDKDTAEYNKDLNKIRSRKNGKV